MRVFQNSGVYPTYLKSFSKSADNKLSFNERLNSFLDDRFGALHILKPAYEKREDFFFTNGDDVDLQKMWAVENGMSSKTTPDEILLAQLESHKAEIFYNLDPMRYGNVFLKRLPGCVKKTIAWRAAPSAGGGFGDYDLLVCNFQSILQSYRDAGYKAEYFFPAYDSLMDSYAKNVNRPIDVLFVGGYSRHHLIRAKTQELIAGLRDEFNVVFCLDNSRLTRLAEIKIVGRLLGLSKHRRPMAIQNVSHTPVFGLQLYHMLSQAKIVLNGAVDMAGLDRGNMRCFEAMGCGAMMLSDDGNYPEHFRKNIDFCVYTNINEAKEKCIEMLSNSDSRLNISKQGHETVVKFYNKETQWKRFSELL